MNILLWVLQILLALHTVMGAVWKFSNSEQTVPSLKVIPHGVWLAMSVFELVCSLCLILPAFNKPLAILAPLAATGIAGEMLLFSGLHIYSGDANHGHMIYWLVVAAICAFIAYGRFVLKPFKQIMDQKKGYKGIGMEGKIADWYAKSTRKDIAEFRSLADRFSNEISPHSRILELAPGPGYLSTELAKRGQFEIVGLDISKSFVEIARENARKESVNVDFRHGNASTMPFADHSFDLIVCRAAFKNFSEPVAALNEMFRTLKAGGRAIGMDLRNDVSFKEVAAYVKKKDMGWFDSLLTKLIFRFLLIPRAYSKDQFSQLASQSRFGRCEIIKSPLGLEVILKK